MKNIGSKDIGNAMINLLGKNGDINGREVIESNYSFKVKVLGLGYMERGTFLKFYMWQLDN